jgi:hypothetical protein
MGPGGSSGVAGGIVITGEFILVIAVVVIVEINLLPSYISRNRSRLNAGDISGDTTCIPRTVPGV